MKVLLRGRAEEVENGPSGLCKSVRLLKGRESWCHILQCICKSSVPLWLDTLVCCQVGGCHWDLKLLRVPMCRNSFHSDLLASKIKESGERKVTLYYYHQS